MLGTTTDPWVILGLEPCSDFGRVRKAYTARVKQTHPEDDPAGFMALREAYEFLRESLERPDTVEVPLLESSDAAATPEPEPTPVPKRPVRERVALVTPDWEVPEMIGRFMDRVRAICRDDKLCRPVDAWRSLLEDDALWRVDVRLELEKTLFEFLKARKKGLVWSVWCLLEEEFLWRDRGFYVPIDFEFDSVPAPVERINKAVPVKPGFQLRSPKTFTLMESRELFTLSESRGSPATQGWATIRWLSSLHAAGRSLRGHGRNRR